MLHTVPPFLSAVLLALFSQVQSLQVLPKEAFTAAFEAGVNLHETHPQVETPRRKLALPAVSKQQIHFALPQLLWWNAQNASGNVSSADNTLMPSRTQRLWVDVLLNQTSPSQLAVQWWNRWSSSIKLAIKNIRLAHWSVRNHSLLASRYTWPSREHSVEIKPPELKIQERVLYISVLGVFALSTAVFMCHGASWVFVAKSAMQDNVHCRDLRFHALLSLSSLILACTYFFDFTSVPQVANLSWTAVGRSVALPLFLMALGQAAGHNFDSVFSALFFGTSASVLLGLASSIEAVAVRWALFVAAVVCGHRTLTLATAMIENCTLGIVIRHRLNVPFDLFIGCCVGYVAEWFLIQGTQVVTSSLHLPLCGALDMMTFVGCSHLLLKREDVLDRALSLKASRQRTTSASSSSPELYGQTVEVTTAEALSRLGGLGRSFTHPAMLSSDGVNRAIYDSPRGGSAGDREDPRLPLDQQTSWRSAVEPMPEPSAPATSAEEDNRSTSSTDVSISIEAAADVPAPPVADVDASSPLSSNAAAASGFSGPATRKQQNARETTRPYRLRVPPIWPVDVNAMY